MLCWESAVSGRTPPTQEMHPRMKGLAEKEKEAGEGGEFDKLPI